MRNSPKSYLEFLRIIFYTGDHQIFDLQIKRLIIYLSLTEIRQPSETKMSAEKKKKYYYYKKKEKKAKEVVKKKKK
jgi:hypothetical protein